MAVLIETMRREGYELMVPARRSSPKNKTQNCGAGGKNYFWIYRKNLSEKLRKNWLFARDDREPCE